MPIKFPKTDSFNKENQTSVVFSVTVDFNSSGYHLFGRLRPSASYNLSREDKVFEYSENRPMMVTYETLKNNIVVIINNELEPIAKFASNNAVQSVDVLETREGSILVLFQAVFNAMQFVSGIKDFYESIELIRKLANVHIKNRLDANYGDYFDVDTTILAYPSKLPLCVDTMLCKKKGACINHLRKERDGFFYYLLVANVILLFLLVTLVFKAVMTVYFT